MRKIISIILVAANLAFAGVFNPVVSAADADAAVLQDIEYSEVIGRVTQNDSGWTVGNTEIYSKNVTESTAPRNDYGWQFYYIDIGKFSKNAKQNGSDCDISESFLEYLDGTLANLRKNGGNCMIRVTYSIDGYMSCEPDTFDQLLTHQTQLANVFKNYPDVISLVECGMIGAFGEMWGGRYSDSKSKAAVLGKWLELLPEEITVNVRTNYEYCYFVNSSDLFNDTYRNQTIDGIKYPPSINGVNYSQYLFDDTVFSRIGCYNDVMVQDSNDGGSFSGSRDNYMRWVGAKADANSYGGEFSGAREYRTRMTTWLPLRAFPEFYVSHLSYYHGGNVAYEYMGYKGEFSDSVEYDTLEEAQTAETEWLEIMSAYSGDMILKTSITENDDGTFALNRTTGGWSTATMNDALYDKIYEANEPTADLRDYQGQSAAKFFEDHLGYRYVLRESYLSESVARGGVLTVKGKVDNTGFANITREKATEIIITDGESSYVIPTDIDVREWDSAKRSEYDLRVKLPADIPSGDYEVYIRIAGKTPEGSTNVKNGVRFCNPGQFNYKTAASEFNVSAETVDIIYDSSIGANYLGCFSVSSEVDGNADDSFGQIVVAEFRDETGGVISVENFIYGGECEAPAHPEKAGDAENESYTFLGWCAEDGVFFDEGRVAPGVYYPAYEGVARKFEVVFYEGETELSRQIVEYGGSVKPPVLEDRSDDVADYRFAGWMDGDGNSCDIPDSITESMTFYAEFECVCEHSYPDEWNVQKLPGVLGSGIRIKECVTCDHYIEQTMETLPLPDFTDVSTADWYLDAVAYAVDNGLFNGVGSRKFAPDTIMTRGMLVTVLYRMEGSPEYTVEFNPFNDVEQGSYYYDAVLWANSENVVNGVAQGVFSPDSPVTREQIATILYRYEAAKGRDLTCEADLGGFVDGASVSAYAVEPMTWAVAKGLIGGMAAGDSVKLDPAGGATRAQVATILMRYTLRY